MSTREEIDAPGGSKSISNVVVSTSVLPRCKIGDLIRAFQPPYFRCIGHDKWWTPLRYAWDEFRTLNLDRL